jgi:hypothetical protein
MRDRLLTAIAAVLLGVWLQTSVAAAAANITVSPSSASTGSTVTISGNVPVSGTASCDPADQVQLTSSGDLFPPDGFGPQATRDASGNFQTHYVIPATTPAGTYSIGMRCGGGNVGITATLRVGAGAALPPTGTNLIVPLTSVGVALLICGLLLTRRRGTSSRPA